MAWVKQSDTLWRDYEFNKLTDGAQALWHRANSYIADNLTDGLVPESAIKQLNTRKRYVDELVTSGRWVWQPAGGWLAVGWQEIIRSKADVLAKREEQKQRDSRKSPRQPAELLPPPVPVPVPVPQFSPEEEEKKLGALSLSETAANEQHARTREARFERPPLGDAPPNTSSSEPTPIRPESRCWQLYQRALGTEHLMLSPNHHDALQALASAAKAEAGGATHGEDFDRAAERILGVWMAEKYWQEKRPGLRNLKDRLEAGKYAVPKQKPIVKLAPQPADSLMEHWRHLDAIKRAEQKREDELNAIRCREKLAEYEALERAGGES
jgi:hypothetical protein